MNQVINQKINKLLAELWQQYIAVTPSAEKIHRLFEYHNNTSKQVIVNDHIALRTFAHPTLGLTKLAQHFLALGYQAKGDYVFKEKKTASKTF